MWHVRGLVGVTWGLLLCGLILAQQPDKFTPEQKEKIQQRNRLQAEAQRLESAGEFQKAIATAEKMLILERELLGKENVVIAGTLRFLGRLHEARDDFASAAKVRKEAVAMLTRLLGKEHWKVTDARLELSGGEQLSGLPAVARQEVRRATVLNRQVLQLYGQGKHRQAIVMATEVVAIRKKLLTENHPDYAQSLNNLASLYDSMGDYTKALPLYEQALDLYKKLLTENHPDYATSLNNLAFLYKAMGDHAKALPLYEQARDLIKKLLTENHPHYAASLNNLAGLYKDMGDYSKALPLYEQARELRKKLLTENHPDYATSLNNLALLYKAMGDHAKALPLYEQARELRKKLLTENHPYYATSLNNLAGLYQDMGDHAKALPLLEQARELRKKLLTENHPDYATSLNNLALLYVEMGDYPKALPLYEQACELRKKLLTENHPNYATSLNNLAGLYQDMGDYPKALPLFEHARDLRKKLLTENHPNYADSLNNLAGLYQDMGDYPKALPLYEQALTKSLRLLEETFEGFGERQRLERLNSLRLVFNNYLLAAKESRSPALEVHAAILKWKGAVSSSHGFDLLLREQPALQPKLQQLHSLKTQLASTAFQTPNPAQRDNWLKRLEFLRDQKESLEAELARDSATFRNLRRSPPSPDQVRRAFPKDTAFLDLVVMSFRIPHAKRKDPKKQYTGQLAAFVVRPDRDVQMVFIDDLKSLETLIEAWRQAVSANNPAAQAEAARQIKQQLWQPLQKHLDAVATVLISADGPLLRFPFAALPGKKPGTFLLEDLAIGYVTSGRHIVDLLQPADKDLTPATGLLALGGVDYGEGDARNAFAALPGAGLEAARVHDLFGKRYPGERGTLLLGEQPTRGRVMEEINKRYRYLHLATHGFFESPERIAMLRAAARAAAKESPEERGRTDEVLAFLPLLKSGLVLAGANTGTVEAGVLTADDLARLDLRGTDLVVLSACETSLGNLTQGDGVLGLQRGFHAGGARTLVSSLWSVNDAATSVLMEEFYQNLWRKEKPLSKLEALRQAQLFVLKNPERVIERTRDLRAQLAKRGLPEEGLRGPKGDAVKVIDDKTEPGQRRSPTAWWAAFVLSGETAEAKK